MNEKNDTKKTPPITFSALAKEFGMDTRTLKASIRYNHELLIWLENNGCKIGKSNDKLKIRTLRPMLSDKIREWWYGI